MKKRAWAAVLLAALLTACGLQEPAETPEEPAYRLVAGWELESVPAEETEAMLNLMGQNRALILDGALYTLDYDEAFSPVLARYALTERGLGEREVLAENCLPQCLTALEGKLIYLNGGAVETLDPDSGDRHVLREGSCSYLQIHEGLLYYCDEAGRFCSAAPDGSGERVLINDRCFYPWLTQGIVLYQSHSDNERLHLFHLDSETGETLTDAASYAPLLVGDRLLCTEKERLLLLDLDGTGEETIPLPDLMGAAEVLPGGEGWLLRWIADENGPRQWTARLDNPEDRSAVPDGYRLCDYAGGSWRVDACYNADGRLRCFALTAPDGTETAYMADVLNGPAPANAPEAP